MSGIVKGDVLTSSRSAPTVAAAAGNTISAVASGALANGDKVILNADGTVTVTTGVNQTVNVAAVVEFSSFSEDSTASAYNVEDGKVVICYRNASDYAVCIVGTITGTTIAFGTAVIFASEPIITNTMACIYDPVEENVIVIFSRANQSDKGYSSIITLSGTVPSFSSFAHIGNSDYMNSPVHLAYDINAEKIIAVYREQGNGPYNHRTMASCGTSTGTSISWVAAVDATGDTAYQNAICYDENAQKSILFYEFGGDNGYGYARVLSISGTTISLGTGVQFTSTNHTLQDIQATYDPVAQKVVVIWGDVTNTDAKACLGTISGTSNSFTADVTFDTSTASWTAMVYDSAAKLHVLAYSPVGGYQKVVCFTVDGSTLTANTPLVIVGFLNTQVSAAYDSNTNEVAIQYLDSDSDGASIVYHPAYTDTNLTTTNYLGISNGAYSNTETATIQTIGAEDDAQSSLTIGSTYYLQGDGTLATTADAIVGAVEVGLATATTKILLKK